MTGSRARLARETTGWTRRSARSPSPPPHHPAAGGPLGALRDEIVGCFDVTDCGDLLMIGRFVDAREDSAIGTFTTREAAEEFVGDDPFLHGVIRNWTVRDWNEGVVPEQRSSGRWVIRRRPSDLQAARLASGRAALPSGPVFAKQRASGAAGNGSYSLVMALPAGLPVVCAPAAPDESAVLYRSPK